MTLRRAALLLLFSLVAPSAALACAVCGGDPNSNMGRSAVWGVVVLLGVVGMVLAGFATAFFCWSRRVRRLNRSPEADRLA